MPQEFSLPYDAFTIGETTEREIIAAFGRDPEGLADVTVGPWAYRRLCFQVESDLFMDCFYCDAEGMLQFLQAYLPDSSGITYEDVLARFGAAEAETFTTFAEWARMMVHAAEGAAFLVNTSMESGGVVAFERFTPLDVEAYLATWGQDLLEENPYEK